LSTLLGNETGRCLQCLGNDRAMRRERAPLPGSRGARLLLWLCRLPPQRVVPRRGLHRSLLLGQRTPERSSEPAGDGVALLQAHDGASDEEAKARADFDLRWKVALGIGLEERPFAKSTLQLFRARLIIHERVRTVFERSLAFARRTGYFRSRKKIKVVLDTSYILGRGAAKDTYNLLGDGVRKLVGALAASADREPEGWVDENMAWPATTSAPASRARQRSTGTTRRRGKSSCGAWSPTPTAC
jgi:hypothetical protein